MDIDNTSQIQTVQLPDFLVLACDGQEEVTEEARWTVTQTTSPRQGMKSLVWKYFTSISSEEVKCDICSKTMRRFGGTTNMRKHLKKWHSSVFAQLHNNAKPNQPAKSEDMFEMACNDEEEGSQKTQTEKYTKLSHRSAPRMRSLVWNYFSYNSSSEATCSICSKIVQTCGGTSNMHKHLKNWHNVQMNFKKIKSDQPMNCEDTFELAHDGEERESQKIRTHKRNTPSRPRARRTRSLVWKHFSSNSSKESKCNICSRIIQTYGGTSNLRKHLSTWHKSAYSQMKEDEPAFEESELKASETYSQVSRNKGGDRRQDSITDAILYMVCKDGIPLSIMDNEGFQFFIKTTAPLYELPGREKLMSHLEEKHRSLRKVTEEQLARTAWVSITADLATVTNKGYLVVTGHYIDREHSRSICLGVSEVTHGDTGDQIASNLSHILHSWNLETKKICSITTYDGANIISAIQNLMGNENGHIPCVANLINLCVCRALSHSKNVTAVIEKVKLIVTYFRRNISASDALSVAQSENAVLVPLELIQAVVTKWNSTFYSLERFIQLAGYVSQVLLSADHETAPPMLTAEELAVITDLVTVLRPFKEATKEVSSNKYFPASTVLPLVNCLNRAVSNASLVNEEAIALNDALVKQINLLLFPLEENQLLASATVLDPRFKVIHFRSIINSNKILQCLSREMQTLSKSNFPEVNPQKSEAVVSNVNDSLWYIHDQLATNQSSELMDLNNSDEVHHELKLYLDLPMATRNKSPLKIWQDLEKTFPILAQLASKYLTVIGSAVASEELVSHLNTVTSDWKNTLSSTHINMLLFMNSLERSEWFSE